MSRWIKYLGLLIPLAGATSPFHVVNVALLPLLGGFVYGYFAERRRDVLLSPLAILAPAALVLVYYSAIDITRLIRYVFIFPLFVALWIALWLLFFTMGALAGYLLRPRRPTDKK
jgi:hypothetical protein